jgi:fermentation-respiration switch protein FrsA (DUF1100 family)
MTIRSAKIFLMILLVSGLSSCKRYALFYYPNRKMYSDPDKLGLACELVRYPSLNGNKLYGLLFQTKQKPKGIIVHFHGNFGNVSNHFPCSYFLTEHGFDVLVFDYQGYGGSEGRPHPKRTLEDGLATLTYVSTRNRNPQGGIGIFGQSLGAAVAAGVAAKNREVKAVVLEAGFSSYRSIARDVAKRSVLTWILYPFYPPLLGTKYDAIRAVQNISPTPVFFIHGSQDRTVPLKMSEALFKKAGEPKRLWVVPGAGHLECHAKAGKKYEEEISDFFSKNMSLQ